MRDNQEIRYRNLQFLLEECAAQIGAKRGAVALLATLSGVKPSLLSMLTRRVVHLDTGKRRHLGDDTAQKLESGMSKPPGWMDQDRHEAKNYREAALLDKLRMLSPGQIDAIERLMDEMQRLQPPPPGREGGGKG